jgi:hypothetical protein
MVVKLKFSALRQDYWYDCAIRLVLGGLATVFAGLVADAYGPAIGGLMLGFPAIFCASATLTSRNERKRRKDLPAPRAAGKRPRSTQQAQARAALRCCLLPHVSGSSQITARG